MCNYDFIKQGDRIQLYESSAKNADTGQPIPIKETQYTRYFNKHLKLTFGVSPKCELRFSDEFINISDEHFIIEKYENSFFIQDVSKNNRLGLVLRDKPIVQDHDMVLNFGVDNKCYIKQLYPKSKYFSRTTDVQCLSTRDRFYPYGTIFAGDVRFFLFKKQAIGEKYGFLFGGKAG